MQYSDDLEGTINELVDLRERFQDLTFDITDGKASDLAESIDSDLASLIKRLEALAA